MENLTKIPAQFTAGDSLQFIVSLPDYPAPTWTLSYALVNALAVITFTSAADGDSHAVDVPAATTAAYQPAAYLYQAYVTSGDERVTVETGKVLIVPNFATKTTGYDARSWVDLAIDALEASIAGRADKTQLVQKISGVEVQHMSLDQQIEALQRLRKIRLSRNGKWKKTLKSRFYN